MESEVMMFCACRETSPYNIRNQAMVTTLAKDIVTEQMFNTWTDDQLESRIGRRILEQVRGLGQMCRHIRCTRIG
jgi:hypothetical protein